MMKYIPDHIMRNSYDPLNEDVWRVYPKSRQLHVSDIMERLTGICDIQIIRIDTYTDGKNFVIVNTREVVYKSANIMLMGKSKRRSFKESRDAGHIGPSSYSTIILYEICRFIARWI